MNLNTDREKLAEAIESVLFDEDEMLGILAKAKSEKVAPVGIFPRNDPEHPAQVHVMVMYDDDDNAFLSIVNLAAIGHEPLYTVVLRTTDGTVVKSLHHVTQQGVAFERIPLPRPGILIGAQLRLEP